MFKKFAICDYPNPSNFQFPNFGLGSTERKFWLIAKTISEWDDFEVVTIGPLWQERYLKKAKHFKQRLSQKSVKKFIEKYGRVDYLFASADYFNDADMTSFFKEVSDKQISYITYPCKLKKKAFDAKSKFLFCYSDEMMTIYKSQKPYKSLLFNIGVNEKLFSLDNKKKYLVWVGRVDEDKSPHYAILAAEKMKIPIYILGTPLRQPEYRKRYGKLFNSKYVKNFGLVIGNKKMRLIAGASCGVYTCGPNYKEAGASTLAEMLCSGIPIAGISWSGNDAVCEAVNNEKYGYVSVAKKGQTESVIVDELAGSISKCLKLDRDVIARENKKRYDMDGLLRGIIGVVDKNYEKRNCRS